MANLKGATFDKQIKNAKIRIEARGQSRHQKQEQHLTHSNALALKRDNYLKSFAEYASSLNTNETKLNNYLNDKVVSGFLQQKAETLSAKSAENFTRGFSALTDALKNTGISTNISKEVFNAHVNYIREQKETQQISTNRDIHNVQEVIRELNAVNPSFGTLATIQSSLGLRVSEAIDLYKNSNAYIKQDNMIHNLTGKGNHIYDPKPISLELQNLLNKGEEVSYQAYQNELNKLDLTSHDFRYTYVKERVEELLNKISYKEALSIVSKEINHIRPDITEWYLSQTSF